LGIQPENVVKDIVDLSGNSGLVNRQPTEKSPSLKATSVFNSNPASISGVAKLVAM